MSENKDILLSKWLQGTITAQELALLEKEYDLDSLRQVMKAQEDIKLEITPADDLWKNIEAKTKSNDIPVSKPKSKGGWFVLVIFLIAIVGFGVWKFLGADVLKTKFNEEKKYQFADGSQTTLGPESTLKFDESKWSNERKLNLKGQAYFDVEPGVNFIVQTKSGSVHVLGTQFDIWSPNNSDMRVQCYEGKVEVSLPNGKNESLMAGQEIYIYKKSFSNSKSINQTAPEWFAKIRNYRGIEIALLLNDIKRFYAVDFNLDAINDKALFSGTLSTDNLEGFLNSLSTSMGYKYERKANIIYFNLEDN